MRVEFVVEIRLDIPIYPKNYFCWIQHKILSKMTYGTCQTVEFSQILKIAAESSSKKWRFPTVSNRHTLHEDSLQCQLNIMYDRNGYVKFTFCKVLSWFKTSLVFFQNKSCIFSRQILSWFKTSLALFQEILSSNFTNVTFSTWLHFGRGTTFSQFCHFFYRRVLSLFPQGVCQKISKIFIASYLLQFLTVWHVWHTIQFRIMCWILWPSFVRDFFSHM